jgi:choline dehydrogenase
MAERLSRDPKNKVLLLEAGGENTSFMVTMPKGIGKLASDPKYSWVFPVGQRRVPELPSTESWIRGKGLGGSSAINGMIWIRGHKEDYESWSHNGSATFPAIGAIVSFIGYYNGELAKPPSQRIVSPVVNPARSEQR